MDITVLFDAGLSVNEARVYLALLELGSASVNDIVRKSGVHRVNAYDVIERLKVKGLISSIMISNKRHYEIANPEELLKIIEAKRENVEEIMPQLRLLYNQRGEKQEVHFFKGPNGVFTAYNMMLEQNATLYGICGSGLNRKILKHRHALWDKQRIQQGMHVKALYFESLRKEKKSDKERLWEIRFLPEKYKSNTMVDICGNLVIILLPNVDKRDVIAIIIENKEIADGYRKQFDFMWQFAKP